MTPPCWPILPVSRLIRLGSKSWLVSVYWWSDHRHEYDLYASAFVREEAAEGYPALAAARLALLDCVPVLPTTEEVDDLAGKLLAGELIPAKAATDAFHIAIATVHRMDFLLTCKGWRGQRENLAVQIEIPTRRRGSGRRIGCPRRRLRRARAE